MLFVGCTGIYEDGTELAKDKQTGITEISVDELKAKITNNEDFMLIDVRQPGESYKGKIEGSVLIPRGLLEMRIGNEDFWMEQYMYPPLKDSTEIIIYCKSGMRGVLATETLLQLGYENVKNLTGGYNAFNPNPDESDHAPAGSGGCGG
ncbi:MAG: rhodanese-like domain-containing protein [Bacteroidetes bacterium]|nr:rhodanese-like domain-containing protein [Bacteroidota bacterium]